MYQEGRGVTQNDKLALEWFRKAADQGHVRAQTNLGVIYATGRGVARDDVEAAKWYAKAAEQGYPKAQYALARDYEAGRGVAQDIVEAHKWYQLAAALGTDDVKAAAVKDGDRLGAKMTARPDGRVREAGEGLVGRVPEEGKAVTPGRSREIRDAGNGRR